MTIEESVKMQNKYITEKIEKLDEYLPNTAEYNIRLDANESPFIPSDKILNEFKSAIDKIEFNRYPDPYATELIEKFAKIYDVLPDNVVAGNGSDELISLICNGFCEAGMIAAVAIPDFSMYEFYSDLAGARVERYKKNDTLDLNMDEFGEFIKENKANIAIFSNPCNPTGKIVSRAELIKFIESTEALVIVDEAYMEFADKSESVIDLAQKYDNLIVLKTLSKAFGSAALRLGFAISNLELIKAIKKIKSPYNVNTISQVLGKIILENQDEITSNVKQIRENVKYLYDKLSSIASDIFESIYQPKTNFVLMKMSDSKFGVEIFEYLKVKKIAIRCMSGGKYLRISAGKKDEIDAVIGEIEDYLYG